MSFRGTPRGKTTRQFYDDALDENEDEMEEPDMGAVADIPPAGKLFIGICESGWGAGSNIVQVMTSCIGIMSVIIGGTQVSVLGFPDLTHQFPMYALIGIGIAGSIQIILHMNAQPLRATVDRLKHLQDFDIKSATSWKDVQNAVTFRSLLFVMAIGGDIVSDATFINLYTHNALIILFWIVFLTGSSTLVMYDGWSRCWQAFEDWRDYRRYHRAYDDEDSDDIDAPDEFVG